jgi:ketosteroid isomerase-like protein
MDHQTIYTWVEGYKRAWKTGDREAIGRLFTEDARYFLTPFDEPWVGRATIVERFRKQPEPSEKATFRYEVQAVEGSTSVVRGWTQYLDEETGAPGPQFSNIWLVKFGADGQCCEFTEWYMRKDPED